MKEITEFRNDKVILNSRMENHEERLVSVESKLGITGNSRNLF